MTEHRSVLVIGAGAAGIAAARQLQAAGHPVTGLEDLVTIFGRKVQQHFVAWGVDPWSQMGYSYVPGGATGLRAKLAEPVDGVLFLWAKRRMSPERLLSTAHWRVGCGREMK